MTQVQHKFIKTIEVYKKQIMNLVQIEDSAE